MSTDNVGPAGGQASINRILYATDGSEDALAAARLLTALTLDRNSTVTALTVAEGAGGRGAEQVLAEALEALARSEALVQTRIRLGKPAVEILREAEESNPDLIVLGSRGLGAFALFFLGSVAERVARHAHCPVLIARSVPDEITKVVLGIDGSAEAAHAAQSLWGFPLPPNCEIRVVTALPNYQVGGSLSGRLPELADELREIQAVQKRDAMERLEEVAAAFRAAGRPAAPEFRRQHAAQGLVEAAERDGADLVVVGRQGLSGITRFVMGSVSEHVLRHAPCSVLIIPQPRNAAA